MILRLKTLLNAPKPSADAGRPVPPPAPLEPVYAVGDIHGRADLLPGLLDKLDADMIDRGRDAAQVVFLGDYVDRGENAAQVLTEIFRLSRDFAGHVTCLMGNHEKMMLEFLDAPEEKGARWLRNGGLQTLASFRVGGVSERAGEDARAVAAYALSAALPDGLEHWLRDLPLTWTSGNLACVHAAAEPDLPIAEQSPRTLLWGHPAFLSQPRSDGIWVAHGHTVMDQPVAEDSRISVDTGAYYTGRLTAAAIYPGETVRFLHT